MVHVVVCSLSPERWRQKDLEFEARPGKVSEKLSQRQTF
jgi:hypothetical protein